MKRYISVVLAFLIMMLSAPIYGYATTGEDLSKRVEVKNFKFLVNNVESNVLVKGQSVKMTCDLKRTDVGEGAQTYVMALQVIDKGRLVEIKKAKGTISTGDGNKNITLETSPLNKEVENYEIVAVIYSDNLTFEPLAPSAIFGGDECEVTELTIGKYNIPLVKDTFEYNFKQAIMENELPLKLQAKTNNLATKVEIEDVNTEQGIAKGKITSHSGKVVKDYKINIDVMPMTEASLKSVSINGTPLSDFRAKTYNYSINDLTKVPTITFEKALDTTTIEVTNATTIPGVTFIKTTSQSGLTHTYKFTFSKTEVIRANKAMQSYNPNKYQLASKTGYETFQSYNYGGKGEMLTITWNGVTGNQSSHGYFNFPISLPLDAVVESVELDYNIGVLNSMDQNPVHIDTYENTDKEWTGKADGEYTNTTIPAISANKINTNDVDLMATSPYSKVTYNLAPTSVIGKNSLSVCAVTRENSNSFGKYTQIAIKGGLEPTLKVKYTKKYAEPEKLTAVAFDGLAFSEFNTETYDYTVEVDSIPNRITATAGDNATTINVINATEHNMNASITTNATAGATKTYNFKFIKVLSFKPSKVAQTLNPSTINVVSPSGYNSFASENYGGTGEMLTITWTDINGSGNSRAYLAFEPSVPLNAEVIGASLDLNSKITNSMTTPINIDTYGVDDLSWTTKADGKDTNYPVPILSQTKVNTNDLTLSPTASYDKITYDLDKNVVLGKDMVSLCALVREPSNSYNKHAQIAIKEGLEPTLKIKYTTKDTLPEALAGVTFDGKVFSDFDKETLDYEIETRTIPTTLATMAGSADTIVTIKNPSENNMKATITTDAGNGVGRTYTFRFIKVVTVTPIKAAQTLNPSTINVVSPAGYNSFASANYGGTGEMLTITWGGIDGSGNSHAYFGFNSNIPLNADVKSANLSLKSKITNSMATPINIDTYESTDLAWMEKADGKDTSYSTPAISENKINTNDLTLSPITSYNKITYSLDPTSVVGKEKFGVCSVVRESSNSYSKHAQIAIKTGFEPTLEIKYTTKDTEPDALAGVAFDGKLFADFDPETLEYEIDCGFVPTTLTTMAGEKDTVVNITNPTGDSTTATIVTTATGGISRTYVFRFIKTLNLKASKVAQTRGQGILKVVSPSGYQNYDSLNSGGTGRVMLISWSNSPNSSAGYMNFNTNVPAGATVTQADLTMDIWVNNSANSDPLHLDIFENTDTSWLSNADGESSVSARPTMSAEQIITNNPDLAVYAGYAKYTYSLDKTLIPGKANFAVGAINRESVGDWSKYTMFKLSGNDEPTITIKYYLD